jgi:transketolase
LAGLKPIPEARDQHLRDMANCMRVLTMDAVQQAKSGHPGAPMGMADIATVLFHDFMQFDAAEPHWIDRDRFIMSNGHGSMLLYSLLYLTGYKDMPIEELKRFRQVGSKTPGHPEYHHADGIELITSSINSPRPRPPRRRSKLSASSARPRRRSKISAQRSSA